MPVQQNPPGYPHPCRFQRKKQARGYGGFAPIYDAQHLLIHFSTDLSTLRTDYAHCKTAIPPQPSAPQGCKRTAAENIRAACAGRSDAFPQVCGVESLWTSGDVFAKTSPRFCRRPLLRLKLRLLRNGKALDNAAGDTRAGIAGRGAANPSCRTMLNLSNTWFCPVTSFSYVLLRLSIVLHDGLAAPRAHPGARIACGVIERFTISQQPQFQAQQGPPAEARGRLRGKRPLMSKAIPRRKLLPGKASSNAPHKLHGYIPQRYRRYSLAVPKVLRRNRRLAARMICPQCG